MTKSSSIIRAGGDSVSVPRGLDGARVAADAMLRAAIECCHQHDRYARLMSRAALEVEHEAADDACALVAVNLGNMVQAYGDAARELRPDGGDAEWWHRANALWLASREFVRRQTCGERLTRRSSKHDPETLAELKVQYDLEASALLGLRHACDAYRKVRPEAW